MRLSNIARISALFAASLCLGACAPSPTAEQSVAAAPPPPAMPSTADAHKLPPSLVKAYSGFLPGYLPREQMLNSLLLVPAPPAAGSAREAVDREQAARSVALHGTPRWQQAIDDANLEFPHAANTFSCALGVEIDEASAPTLYTLLRRTMSDGGFSTYAAKNKYRRARPFTVNNAPLCTPEQAQVLRNDGSYPSGHSALGWVWTLVLAELSPAQADAIVARGRAFGDSRSICNVHWASDIAEGRVVGAAVVARLHAEPAFRDDMAKARIELDALRAQGRKPSRDCAAEAAALAIE